MSQSAWPLTSLAVALALIGCEPRALRWEYDMPSSLDGSTIRARVLSGSCAGSDVRWETSFVDGSSAPSGPRLAAGGYGLEVVVTSADCEVIGRGCVDVTLPRTDVVRVVATAVTPEPLCTTGCAAGVCEPPDAGSIDAGTDTGSSDAGVDAATDANVDAPSDAGPPGSECTMDSDCPCPADGDHCVAGWCTPDEAFTQVAAGAHHSCGIARGRLFCWGTSGVGEIGGGDYLSRERPNRVGTLIDWTYVASMGSTTCGIAGDVPYCWGSNWSMQVGIVPEGADRNPTSPRAVVIPGGLVPVRVSIGQVAGLARDATGRVAAWGGNSHREAGGVAMGVDVDAGAIFPSVLTRQWIDVDTGNFSTCGISSEGALACWGAGGSIGLSRCTDCGPADLIVPPENPTWAHVELGNVTACAWDDAGVLYCWGRNTGDSPGAAGSGTSGDVPAPGVVRREDDTPITVVDVSVSLHTCVVRTDGGISCFGPNGEGQLGVGDRDVRLSAADVAGTNWAHVAAGGSHTCATRRDGALFCWGNAHFGALGVPLEVPFPVDEDGGVEPADHLEPTRVCSR